MHKIFATVLPGCLSEAARQANAAGKSANLLFLLWNSCSRLSRLIERDGNSLLSAFDLLAAA